MRFASLFEVRVIHTYYSDQGCPDFEIAPTAQTQALLRNHRSLFKPMPTGIRVITAMNETGTPAPMLPMAPDPPLTFHLQLRNPDFPLFTDLSAMPVSNSNVFTNKGLKDNGTSKDEADPLKLDSNPADLRDRANRFADLVIHPPSAFTANHGPVQYDIVFEAKQTRWHYYLITDLKDDASAFEIVDSTTSKTSKPLQFSAGADLAHNRDPSDEIAERLMAEYPNLTNIRFIRFVSDDRIRCRQAPYRNLQMKLNGNRLYNPLPNPALQHYYAQAVTGPGSSPQKILFHTIKYFAASSLNTGG